MQRFAQLINRLWRLLGTAISFSVFGLSGLVLGITVFPVLWMSVRNAEARSRIARRIVSAGFWCFVQIMRLLGVLDYKISGLESVSGATHSLVVANHPSLIDVVFLIGLFPKIDCVVKSAMWTNPFTSVTVRSADYIRNDSPDILMDKCITRLSEGRNLILFPEGTRSEPNTKLQFGRGAATIAIRARAKMIAVQIDCQPTTLTKGEKWYQIPKTKPVFSLQVLPVINSEEYSSNATTEKEAAQNLTKDLKQLLSKHLEISG